MNFFITSLFLHSFIIFCSEEKDETLSAVSGGSFKPEISAASTSHAAVTTPTLTASLNAGNPAQNSTLDNDDSEYSVKPTNDSWDKNGSPQKSKMSRSMKDNYSKHEIMSF